MASASTKTESGTFPKEMVFQKTWRTYQARLLDRLNSCLDDKRLHVVAAPGSGKTVFGLEVVRRIDQPTLILAPTITIRNQWIERLVQHFLPDGSPQPDWVSTDIRHPKLLTAVTYQALHSLCSGQLEKTQEEEREEENGSAVQVGNGNGSGNGDGKLSVQVELPESLLGFKTLVVDEAHHLKAEWWRTLTFVADRLKPTIVALTATPPFDVSPYEWQRYEELCGPVDAEVAVPELVLQGDLCPHQDYVYFSVPAVPEQKTLAEFRSAVDAFVERLRNNREFATAVAIHPWITDPNGRIEEILEDPEYLSSIVVYLNAAGEEIPREVLRALGIGFKSIPALALDWLETLLTHCLYTDAENFRSIDPILKATRHELLQIGAIERRKVVLRNPSDHTKLLTTSKTKLHSMEEIVRLESAALKDKLRCVVLTDFIRKAELPKAAAEKTEFEDIGVVPIFETLRRSGIPDMRLGVLCGSLVVVPEASKEIVTTTAARIGIRQGDLAFRPMPHDPTYVLVEITGEYHEGSVRLITSVFEQGGITVLVGTKSLLGEGWDAPTINTLILASFVGSYVLSNQMRGRSIRIDPACPGKTANVWHLVCVEPGIFGPGDDYALLTRRCNAFVGVSATSPAIENGTERLGLGHPPYSEQQIADLNTRTVHRALDREGLCRSWDEALAAGSLKQMTDGLKAEEEALPRGFILRNTIAALLIQSGLVFLTIFFGAMRRPVRLRAAEDFVVYFAVITGIAAAVSLPWAILAVWRFMRHGTPERSIKQIGSAVLDALQHEGSIDAASSEFRVYANRNQDGSVYCWIGGGTGRDQAIYVRALREVLRPVENPRYLLARTKFWRLFREDYFAVPDVLARKKDFAEFFARKWRRHVGPVELVYTRTPEGRKVLLRARMHSLAAAFQKRAERVSCWK
jgi:superfamily II DNA or RNA helicase